MYSYGTSVLFVCRLCKTSFQIVDDFIEHKKEEHSLEFRTSNCIVFEDVRILNTCNDEDDVDKKCGTLTTVEEKYSTVPWKVNPNVPVNFENENTLTNVDPLDISHCTEHIPHDLAESFDRFPILTTSDFKEDGNNDTPEISATSDQEDVDEASDTFFQENHDYQQEKVDLSQASTVNVCFELIKPKIELIQFVNDNSEKRRTTASVDLDQLPKNPYVLFEKLSSKEIRNLQNQDTAVQTELTSKSQCRLCLKKFNSEADLQIHCRVCILDNSNWLRYCVPCSKFFSSKRAQNMHQIRHHGADGEQLNLLKFKCDVCLKPYSRKDVLRRHIKSHKETNNAQSKPFKCDTCSASFFTKYDFTRHQASHTTKRPFQCPEPDCGSAFKLNVNLTKHLKCVHANIGEPFNCPEPNCFSTLKCKDSFEKHFRKFHTFYEKMSEENHE